MSAHKIPMTRQGYEQLQTELHHLKTVERPRIIAAIAEARAHGDLRENAEYHAAKESQSFTEGRIADIESKVGNVMIVDVRSMVNDGTVVFGATVTIVNLETEARQTYQIVGEDEADIKSAKLSVASPIARALIGKHINNVVVVHTPNGPVEYEISKVEYI